MLISYIKQNKQILSFLTVGLLTAICYFSLFSATWKWMHIDYKIAVSFSYITAAFFQFLANRYITFKSGSENIFYQLLKFIVLAGINYVLTLIIVITLVSGLSFYPYIAVIISIGVTVISGFLISKLWVYIPNYEGGK